MKIDMRKLGYSDVSGSESKDVDENWDDLESAILYLLDCSSSSGDGGKMDNICDVGNKKNTIYTSIMETCNSSFVKKDKKPKNTILSSFGDRWYSPNAEDLLTPVRDILEKDRELCFFVDGKLTWSSYNRIKKLPKDLAVCGRATDYFEYHFRRISNNKEDYVKGVQAFNQNHGKEMPLRFCQAPTRHNGVITLNNDYQNNAIIAHCSVIEDYYRSNAFQVEITIDSTIRIAVDRPNIYGLLEVRNGPIANTKKSPVIHWVSSHLRKTKTNSKVVKQHLKGVQEFDIDGCHVKITPPKLHVDLIY